MKNNISLIDELRLYQFGNGDDTFHLYKKEGLSYDLDTSLALNTVRTLAADGSARLNGLKRSKKEDYFINIDFLENSRQNLDFIYKIYYGEPTFVFFYKVDFLKNGGNRIKDIYYTLAEPASPVKHAFSENTPSQAEKINKSVSLRLLIPFFFRVKLTDLSYYNDSNVQYNAYNSNVVFNSGAVYTASTSTTFPPLSNLSNQELFDLINNSTSAISVNDRFLLPKNVLIKPDFAKTLTQSSEDVDLQVSTQQSFDNFVYLIQLSELQKDEEVKITNLNNDSEVTIKWLDNNSSGDSIIFNSFKRKFYYATSQKEIDLEKIKYDYSVDNQLLFFVSNLSSRITFDKTQVLNFTKNTNNNIDFKLEILSVYN